MKPILHTDFWKVCLYSGFFFASIDSGGRERPSYRQVRVTRSDQVLFSVALSRNLPVWYCDFIDIGQLLSDYP
jgi:hypothetical protein